MEEQVKFISKKKIFFFYISFLQLNQITISNHLQNLIQQLINQHKKVFLEIEDLYNRDHQPARLTKQLTHAVETLV
jgi:hypothetical protein